MDRNVCSDQIRREATAMRHVRQMADGQKQNLQDRDEDGEYPLEEPQIAATPRAAVRTRLADRIRHRIWNVVRHRRKRPSEMYTERSRDR